jgi:hypothetical protein
LHSFATISTYIKCRLFAGLKFLVGSFNENNEKLSSKDPFDQYIPRNQHFIFLVLSKIFPSDEKHFNISLRLAKSRSTKCYPNLEEIDVAVQTR